MPRLVVLDGGKKGGLLVQKHPDGCLLVDGVDFDVGLAEELLVDPLVLHELADEAFAVDFLVELDGPIAQET